ncbi:hypothetical protein BXO88_14540 [Oribacterium sp. C9]|uniref:glycosyltransferase n=1 Tax=Oribacterium sp. C9 TaxID=1943579 RepID=UPI00098F948A|nr:glycosyltransferase [Oribacterium sp. C9]OON85002.1 hypothetical protein BXO88_14540 [Oribacterium sp. C9]
MEKLCIVMVSYYPKTRTYQAIDNLISTPEIGIVVIVDNTPDEIDYFEKYNKTGLIIVIKNRKNLGIANAQNKGIQIAMSKGYEWVLTIDQDTIINRDLAKKYISYITSLDSVKNIGLIGTDYIDVSTMKPKFGNTSPIKVDETISSGSLINLSIYNKIGNMKDIYFIDQVDNEYCYRILKNGFNIVILPGIGMEHKLGNITVRRFFFRRICIYNQSPIRTYYRTRNSIWFVREYHDYGLTKKKCDSLLLDLIRFMYEKNKIQKYKMFLKGLKDGFLVNYKQIANEGE